jgi:FKBP12-rapamycin complex-associated protein
MPSIFELIHSPDIANKISGILEIERELSASQNVTEGEITRFANYLRIVIPTLPIQASKALGKLALTGANLTPDFVDFEVKRALEWLQNADRVENRRFAAILVLGELCKSAPRYSSLYFIVKSIIRVHNSDHRYSLGSATRSKSLDSNECGRDT